MSIRDRTNKCAVATICRLSRSLLDGLGFDHSGLCYSNLCTDGDIERCGRSQTESTVAKLRFEDSEQFRQ